MILDIVSDKTKFREISTDPTLKREGQLQRFLLKLKKKGVFKEDEYKRLYPKGSMITRIYGLPKIHKLKNVNDKLKLRPIVSAIGSYNYHLADYLGKMLTPYISQKYTTKDTFSFVNELSQISSKDTFLISYDVTSLITNIPLSETIDLAVNTIFQHEPNLKMKKEELRKLFTFATSESHFIFDGKIYDQIDGVTMGSPLGPVLANLFMGYHEGKWIENYGGSKPIHYKRFMDDIFCIFKNEIEAIDFLNYLNEQHVNIKFTTEKEEQNTLPFLDVQIVKLDNGKFETSVYRKPTFTGLLTNFKSFTPFSYKIALIKTLIHRIYHICSSWKIFHRNILEIENILRKNSYPQKLIEKEKNKYLTNKLQHKERKDKENLNYFKLPYIGETSKITKTKILEICQKYCKNLKISISFSLFKTGSFFSVKDRIPPSQRSHVVYLYSCPGCGARYVGETTRQLKVRVDEHLSGGKGSVIFEHIDKNQGCKNMQHTSAFKIIDQAPTEFQLMIKESIQIRLKHPSLNKQIKHENINLIF